MNKPEMSRKKCSYWTISCCHNDAIPKVMRSTRTGSLKSDKKIRFPRVSRSLAQAKRIAGSVYEIGRMAKNRRILHTNPQTNERDI